MRVLVAMLGSTLARTSFAAGDAATSDADGPANFRTIYASPELRKRFYLFLKNVFHLYPEDRFHRLITEVCARYRSDREIYEHLGARLAEITPVFSRVTYALPALAKQKAEMARETVELLGRPRPIRGYVEIGTPGRYVKGLRKRFPIEGAIYVVNDKAPALSIEDVLERGQLAKAGTYVPLGDYDPFDDLRIRAASVDLVTNYIGFHHAPADRLDPFVHSIWNVLRPGGRLVLRDHDVDRPTMQAMVGLAHDVFNAGIKLSWAENHAQVRNFTSVRQIERRLAKAGFERTGGVRFQEGDPTRNALMVFVKRA